MRWLPRARVKGKWKQFLHYWFFQFSVTTTDGKFHAIFHALRSLTSLELFFDSRDWLQRNCGGFSLIESRWAFGGFSFSRFVSLSIIWASKSRRSGGGWSSSDGSLLRSGRTIASGLALIVAANPSATIVSSPVVSRFSSAISSALKGTVGILSIECHSRITRRMFTLVLVLRCKLLVIQPEIRHNLIFIVMWFAFLGENCREMLISA